MLQLSNNPNVLPLSFSGSIFQKKETVKGRRRLTFSFSGHHSRTLKILKWTCPHLTGKEAAPKRWHLVQSYTLALWQLAQETASLLLRQFWKNSRKVLLKRIFLPSGFCYTAKNTHWFLIIWLVPWNSFSVLVYLLAVLSDGEQFQNVKRAILEPCVPGVLKDCVGISYLWTWC